MVNLGVPPQAKNTEAGNDDDLEWGAHFLCGGEPGDQHHPPGAEVFATFPSDPQAPLPWLDGHLGRVLLPRQLAVSSRFPSTPLLGLP